MMVKKLEIMIYYYFVYWKRLSNKRQKSIDTRERITSEKVEQKSLFFI